MLGVQCAVCVSAAAAGGGCSSMCTVDLEGVGDGGGGGEAVVFAIGMFACMCTLPSLLCVLRRNTYERHLYLHVCLNVFECVCTYTTPPPNNNINIVDINILYPLVIHILTHIHWYTHISAHIYITIDVVHW